jgi:hypothetical protein
MDPAPDLGNFASDLQDPKILSLFLLKGTVQLSQMEQGIEKGYSMQTQKNQITNKGE